MKKNYLLLFVLFLALLSACSTEATTVTTTTTNKTTSPVNLTDDCIEKDGFTLTFCDAFNGDGENVNEFGVDLDKWAFQLGTGSQYGLDGWGNNEAQYYREENAVVENGKLVITAENKTFGGKSYVSSRLYTDPTFTQTYGRFEAKMKLPAGQGLWPAFWMMPKDSVYGGWAASGELDIMEARGRLINEVGGTIHYGSQWPNNRHTGKNYYFPSGQNIMQFHEYAVEWEPGEIRWYVDGNLYQTQNSWYSEGNPFPAPFDQDFYLILNLAIGGNYDGGRMPEDSMLPATMEVDYVRVYEFNYDQDVTPPSTISNITLTSSLPEKATIEWQKATDDSLVSYDIYLNDELQGNTYATSYTFTDLDVNETYKISVESVDMGGNKSSKVDYEFSVNYPLATSRIEAEHYINMSGIQIENSSDASGKNVGYIEKDDYLEYKVNVTSSGTYKILYRIASESNGGDLSLFVDGTLTNNLTFNATGGWQNWKDELSQAFELETGLHTIKLVANKDGFNINYFEFQKQ